MRRGILLPLADLGARAIHPITRARVSRPHNEIVPKEQRRYRRSQPTGDDPMSYQLKTDNQGYHVMHVETGECAGYLERQKKGSGFIVHRALALRNEREKIAVIKSVDEAVPTLAAYNEKTPPRWTGSCWRS